jgi:hypothetical protein
MTARLKMPGRVPVRAGIAAADVTARFAQTKMHPSCADFQTIFAAVRARRNFSDFAQMFTTHRYKFFLSKL